MRFRSVASSDRIANSLCLCTLSTLAVGVRIVVESATLLLCFYDATRVDEKANQL